MAWIYLVIAGLFEIAWAIGLKYTEGFTRLWPSAGTVAAMIVSFLFLAESLKSIPVGTGYAVWTGIGAAGTAVGGSSGAAAGSGVGSKASRSSAGGLSATSSGGITGSAGCACREAPSRLAWPTSSTAAPSRPAPT